MLRLLLLAILVEVDPARQLAVAGALPALGAVA
jgi:hypothetical protein